LQNQVTTLTEDLENCSTNSTNLQNQVTTLTEDLENCSTNSTNLQNQVTTLTEDLENCSTNSTNLQNQVTTLTEDLESCSANNTNLQNQVTTLTADLENCSTNSTNLQNQVTTLTEDLENCSTNNTNLQNQVTTLTDDLENCSTNNTSLQNQVTTLTEDLENCSTNNTNLQNQVTTLTDNLASCNTNNTNLQNQVTTLTEDLENCINNTNFQNQVTGVSLNKPTISLIVGTSERLTVTVEPANAANKTVTWSSDNSAVATVDNDGIVTAVAAGTATITVTTQDGNKTATCEVTVTPPVINVTNVTLNKSDLSLIIGGTEQLTATIEPDNATDKMVTWSSSNTAVATVDNDGIVTAVAAGIAIITVTTQDGDKIATCTVKVEDTSDCSTPIASGTAGEYLTWILCPDGTLTISGNGEIPDCEWDWQPWYSHRSSITAVVIEHGVTRIGQIAFAYSDLTTVTIPNSVTSIGESAFYSCSKLMSVIIPNSVTSVGTYAFYACFSLTTIDVDENNMDYASEAGVLFDKTKNVLIQYPAKKADTYYAIPNTVTTIRYHAFQSCHYLTSVTIPNTIISIEGSAFNDCTGLTEIINHAISPQTIDASVFEYVNKSAVTLYVPAASVNAYRDAGVWEDFLNIEAIDDSNIHVSGVSLNKTEITLAVGASERLTATIVPSNATNKTVTWSSGNTAVATVDNDGIVTAVAVGTATITVTTQDGNKTANCIVTVNALVNAATPSITAHPQSAVYAQNATAAALTVTATVSDAGTRTYQWYSNTTNSNTGGASISGATAASYTPPTTTVGTQYYYVIVTNTNNSVNGAKTATAASATAAITVNTIVNAANPSITAHPQPATYTQNATATALTVTATVSDAGTLTYQWYSNTANSNTSGAAISGATVASYTPPTTTAGTIYYYVIVTNTNNSVNGTKTATATSNTAAITVNAIVNAATPSITTHPQPAVYEQNATAAALTVTATVSDAGTRTYQWYSNTANSNTSGTSISGATAASYTPPTTTVGTLYYYVVVTNTNNSVNGTKTATATSNTAAITITPQQVAVTGVSLNKNTLSLAVGGSEQLTAIVAPDNAANKTVTWSSGNTAIATVSSNGTVTAVAAGTATITVTTQDGNKTANCTVTVTQSFINVTNVTLNKSDLSLVVGGNERLTATVEPANATNQTVTWNSGNTAIATVDNNGSVTAIGAGTTFITVTTQDGNKTAVCVVTVTQQSVTSTETSEALLARVYPNPTDDAITLEFETDGVYNLNIADMTGKVLMRQTVNGQRAKMDMSSYPAGAYLLTVDDGKRQSAVRVVRR